MYVLVVTHCGLKGRRDCRPAGPVKVVDTCGLTSVGHSAGTVHTRQTSADVARKSSNSTTTDGKGRGRKGKEGGLFLNYFRFSLPSSDLGFRLNNGCSKKYG